MCHEDIRTRIQNALRDAAKAMGEYGCYVAAIFGDDKSGNVVYSCGYGDGLKRAGYTIKGADCTIDIASAVDVQPLTTYEAETAEVTEAGARNSKRDLSQLQAIHDAAMKLGAACSKKEAAQPVNSGLKLVESAGCEFLGTINVSESARVNYPVKIMSPGTGATAHYSSSVVESAAGLVKPGTLMFWNHPTEAEERARPEGDLNNLAAIITSPGKWDANGAKGPGIYAEAKVMADYAQKVEERAPHIGLSIRAGGTATGKLVEGKPELASIDYIESVDYVTKAGRGGMALAEAARNAGILEEGQVEMDEAAIKKLIADGIAAGITAATAPLREAMAPLEKRALRGDAVVVCSRALATIGFSESQKQFVVDTVLRESLPVKDGLIDEPKLTELVTAEAKRYGATLGNGARVVGLGTPAAPIADPVKIAEAAAQVKANEAGEVALFMELGLSEAAAKSAVVGRAN